MPVQGCWQRLSMREPVLCYTANQCTERTRDAAENERDTSRVHTSLQWPALEAIAVEAYICNSMTERNAGLTCHWFDSVRGSLRFRAEPCKQ